MDANMIIIFVLKVAALVMVDSEMIIGVIFNVVALAMGIVSIVMGFFPKEIETKTQITLLGIGLTSLALSVLL